MGIVNCFCSREARAGLDGVLEGRPELRGALDGRDEGAQEGFAGADWRLFSASGRGGAFALPDDGASGAKLMLRERHGCLARQLWGAPTLERAP